MEIIRICPRCRKRFPQDAIVCEECGEQLIDAAPDFDASVSLVREPVLLSNGRDVDTEYLEEELKARDVPYYVEEGQNAVPTRHFDEGIVEIVPFTNYYVDKCNWRMAKEALKSAREETREDKEPAVSIDTLKPEPEDGPVDEGTRSGDAGGPGGSGSGGFLAWFMGQGRYTKMLLGAVAFLFLIGLVGIALS